MVKVATGGKSLHPVPAKSFLTLLGKLGYTLLTFRLRTVIVETETWRRKLIDPIDLDDTARLRPSRRVGVTAIDTNLKSKKQTSASYSSSGSYFDQILSRTDLQSHGLA